MGTPPAAPAPEPLLRVEGLTTELPTPGGWFRAIEDVSLSVAAGEVFALVGESGCGKSVTALSIPRLLPPRARSAGSVMFDGPDLLELDARQMRHVRGDDIAIVLQSPFTALNPSHRIGAQISEVIRAHATEALDGRRSLMRSEKPGSPVWQRSVELLDSVGIRDPEQVARKYPHELSGGMCQRAVIATALAGKPRLLIADEPTTALDVTVQRDIVHLLDALRRRERIGIILISHDVALVAEFADRAAVLYAGQIVETGPTEALIDAPAHPYTRGLVHCVPDLGSETAIEAIPGNVPTRYDRIAGCRFRERCSRATPQCAQKDIPMIEVAHDRYARCILYEK